MSDERLRELERRFRSTGSPEDEAPYLRECLRAATIDKERVRIAAFLGHVPALLALGDDAPEPLTPDSMPAYRLRLDAIAADDLGSLAIVGTWGQELCMRLAIAAVTHAIKSHESKRQVDVSAVAQASAAKACLQAAELWVLDERFGKQRRPEPHPFPSGTNNLASSCRGLCHLASPVEGPPEWRLGALGIYVARSMVAAARISRASRPSQERERAALLALAREDIARWALGRGDPIRERHDSQAGHVTSA